MERVWRALALDAEQTVDAPITSASARFTSGWLSSTFLSLPSAATFAMKFATVDGSTK